MRVHKLLAILLFINSVIKANAQEAKLYFKIIDSIVLKENVSTELKYHLDTLRQQYIPSRSGYFVSFDRDIDFNFRHQRINVTLNFEKFQIDLLTKNDSIITKTIRHYYNPFDIKATTIAFDSSMSVEKVTEYLFLRNKFYHSHKTSSDLIKEISEHKVFAFYCGDGNPLTREGKFIKGLVTDENEEELYHMLQSFSVETQAYGVSGFKLMERNGYSIPAYIIKLIKHIRRRNSDLITCAGCFSGISEKIYSKK